MLNSICLFQVTVKVGRGSDSGKHGDYLREQQLRFKDGMKPNQTADAGLCLLDKSVCGTDVDRGYKT